MMAAGFCCERTVSKYLEMGELSRGLESREKREEGRSYGLLLLNAGGAGSHWLRDLGLLLDDGRHLESMMVDQSVSVPLSLSVAIEAYLVVLT